MDDKEKNITIRVNGKDRPVQEVKAEIQNKDEEIAASIDGDFIDQPFEWVLPKENTSSNLYLFHANRDESESTEYDAYSNERKPGLPIHRKKLTSSLKRPFSAPKTPFQLPKQLLVPIVSAVVIGGIIGLIVLMIFTGDEFKSNTTPAATQPVETPVKNPISAPKTTSLNTIISPYVVQAGLYSSAASAEEIANNIIAKGYAAAVDPVDYRVYIGISSTLEGAKALASVYENTEILAEAPYSHSRTMGEEEISVPTSGDTHWLESGKALLELSYGTADMNTMESDLLSWKKEAMGSVEKLTADQQKKAVAFINSMSAVVDQNEGKWTIQQAKLDATIHYIALVQSFKK
ncbi:SPOR domain-containing protein [Pseudalkalibacillus berkeleyi]|uniref:SPOR domain-containing protein n=1 Tax=Pseudalkalibacillus berkeleyi TaxID=1069813 RepID=A0ABS9H371_9BACL|nr:SPOR domain-containing protein [Pseudalkalibacillus berkeleyi]MCF6138100.1 SPOR domain-containing protein [Pseudalkalibacillus berkeleyi]